MLTPTEQQAIMDEVEAGTFDLEDALNDIATEQRGEGVRRALYGGILLLNHEGKAGAVDVKARQTLANHTADATKRFAAMENEIANFIANNSGTLVSTRRDATTLSSTAVTVETSDVYGSVSLADSISNYDYIEIQYSAGGRTQIAAFTPAQLRGTVHWSELIFSSVVVGASNTPLTIIVFKANCETDDEILVTGYKYVWSGDASSNGKALLLESSDSAKIMAVRGVKYTQVSNAEKDTELTDLRVGYDDTEYDSAGEAVRAQIAALWEAVNSINVAAITVDENGYLRFDGGDSE